MNICSLAIDNTPFHAVKSSPTRGSTGGPIHVPRRPKDETCTAGA